MFVIYFMSTVQFVFQDLLNGEVFYDVANELQILRERERLNDCMLEDQSLETLTLTPTVLLSINCLKDHHFKQVIWFGVFSLNQEMFPRSSKAETKTSREVDTLRHIMISALSCCVCLFVC